MYPAIIVIEHIWPTRTFPKVRYWNVALGIVLFVYIAILNVVVLNFLPLDWLEQNKLFDLSQLGLVPSVMSPSGC